MTLETSIIEATNLPETRVRSRMALNDAMTKFCPWTIDGRTLRHEDADGRSVGMPLY